MPGAITVQCPKCNKDLNVPADAVGKKIRCKHCNHVFVLQASAAKKGAKSAKKSTDDSGDNKAYGLTEAKLGNRCPECANQMESEDAIVCLHCGYNTQTRTRAQMKKVADVTGKEIFLWQLPGYICAVLSLALLGLVLWMLFDVDARTIQSKEKKDLQKVLDCTCLWLGIGSLFGIYKLGRFAVRRLFYDNQPPEVEIK
jgi:DNA-directed RNA polymerase subunit RPC12/RpoP